MVIRIEETSEIPIYVQIRNQIVMGISSGELSPGEQLPTVRALAEEMGVNTMTVSKAYQQLKVEGYIVTERKRGARVREQLERSGTLSDTNLAELKRIVSEARICGINKQAFLEIVEAFFEE